MKTIVDKKSITKQEAIDTLLQYGFTELPLDNPGSISFMTGPQHWMAYVSYKRYVDRPEEYFVQVRSD